MQKYSKSFFPSGEEINKAIHSFTYKQMIIFIVCFGALIVSVFLMVKNISDKYSVERPLQGGSFTEGVIGSPRFINPVLAISNTDRDLTSLVFSGLTKKIYSGDIENDLAESYLVSDSGLTYTFTIKEGATFHNKQPITADDVIFTITKIQDGQLKSPYQANWSSVAVTKIDNKTIQFRLAEAYSTFLESTTVGIIPSSLWGQIDIDDFTFSDANIDAVGSGAYRISNIDRKKNGLIDSVTLRAFSKYVGGEPYISKVKFVFFKNEEDLIRAYRKGSVDQINAIDPEQARLLENNGKDITASTLSRIFGLFFNSNKLEIFRNKNVIKAINLAINKQEVVDGVLHGYGKTVDSPIPESLFPREEIESPSYEQSLAEANSLLEKEGWKLGENGFRTKDGKTLGFSISTGDAAELQKSAEIIKNNLAKIGVSVEVKIFEIANLNQSVIRPREYEVLFFGQIISNETDLFAFWHSSQRNDPGLNVAIYTNSKVDGLLEKIIENPTPEKRREYFEALEKEIKSDAPAVFIYSPDFIYLTDSKIKNIKIDHITLPSERLLNIRDWYIRTERVWEFLIK